MSVNILFISNNCNCINLTRILKEEGHAVKLYIKDKYLKNCFDNIVDKTKSWRKELNWVGKDGLIVFDDVGWGKDQDKLRKKGYTVFGGSDIGEKLEVEREFGQKIFAECGLKTVPLKDFTDMEEAVIFVKNNPAPWVIKQNDHGTKFLNHVGYFDDGRDVISILKNYLQNKNINQEKITLHKRIYGIEIGVGRYFNGKDWVGPIEMNVEHTRFFPGDLGTTTTEMGTVAWYDEDENNKLFKDILNKLKPYLQKIDFRGDFEINCIVNESGAYPLEATARFGTPIIHLQSELHLSPWGEFLKAVASGQKYDLKFKKGYGVVLLMAVPPFPYSKRMKKNIFYGVNINFDNLLEEDKKHIHFEEVAMRVGKYEGQLFIPNNEGYIAYTTGEAKTISEARERALGIAEKVIIPKVFYRNDIGKKFEEEDMAKLKKWGYLG